MSRSLSRIAAATIGSLALAWQSLPAAKADATPPDQADAAMLLSVEAGGPTDPELTPDDLSDWLDGYLPVALAEADIVGAVVAIVSDGNIVASRGYGYADLENQTPVDPQTTLFRPGSISKLFTWTAVMQLVEQGEIDLDADVNTYLDFKIPEYNGQPITMREILTHTTGFDEVAQDLIGPDTRPAIPLSDYVKAYLPKRVYAPGAMPAYSNYATALAGYIVQRISGEPFSDYLQRHIFDPLGMSHSTFEQPLTKEWLGSMAVGYLNKRDGKPQAFEVINASPAGALTSTGDDMAKFMIAHLNGGAGLLQPETARMMHEYVDRQFPGVNSMALGFYHNDMYGQRIIGHGGDTNWFHSDLSLLLDQKVGVFISMNAAGADGLKNFTLRDQLLRAFVRRYFPPAPQAELKALPTALEHGALVAGDYESSRGSRANPLKVFGFVSQTSVKMLPNGDLIGPGIPDSNGALKTWREVEPWVWQAVGDTHRMGARVENGKVTAIAFEPMAFAIPSIRAPWWGAKSIWLPLLGFAAIIVALTVLSWPLRAVARGAYGKAFPYEGARAQAHRIGAFVSLSTVAFVGAWTGYFAWLISNITNIDSAATVLPLTLLYAFGVVQLAVLVAAAYLNWNLWRAPASWFAKIWGAVILISAAIVIWIAIAMNLFSFNYAF